MNGDFHNSTGLQGQSLQAAKDQVISQDGLIEQIFKSDPEAKYSPEQIHEIFEQRYSMKILLTSIRRSISNLTDSGILMKLGKEDMVMGLYGAKVNRWKFNNIKSLLTVPLSQPDMFQTACNH